MTYLTKQIQSEICSFCCLPSMNFIHSSNCDHIGHLTKAPFSTKSSEMIGTMYVQIRMTCSPKERAPHNHHMPKARQSDAKFVNTLN